MKNRWLMAAAAIGVHISIGSVYAWSVVTKPLMNQFGWEIEYVSLTFSIAIFFVGISAAFFGNLVEKYGPRKTVSIAAVLFGAGLVGAGFALNIKSLTLLYLTYGVFGGIGLGIAYIPPVVTLIKWFPDRRGLATGLAIMGFGFAALICGPVMNRLITSVGLPNMFYILGGVYFTVMLACSQYLAFPPAGWIPVGYKADINNDNIVIKADIAQLTANQAIHTPHFYLLWLMLFINITCGIAIQWLHRLLRMSQK
jgi:OFA family oxalate/formate antiporter-like MFS transporter